MRMSIEGFGVRVSPRSPFVAQRLGGEELNSLRIHRLGVGSAAVTPGEHGATVKMLRGAQPEVLEFEPGNAEAEWRVVTDSLTCVHPVELAVLGAETEPGLEFRFNRIASSHVLPRSLTLPDGSQLPYGPDFFAIQAPAFGTLAEESQLAREFGQHAELLAQQGKRLAGVSTLPEAGERIRVIDLVANDGSRHERIFLVALGDQRVVTFRFDVDARGLQVAGTFAEVIVRSLALPSGRTRD